MDVMWILVSTIFLQTTVYSLLPLAVIFVFIVAAAGITRGTDIFQLLGIGAIMGVGSGVAGGGAGKGLKAANPRSATAKMASASRAKMQVFAKQVKSAAVGTKNPVTKERERGFPGFSKGGAVAANWVGNRVSSGRAAGAVLVGTAAGAIVGRSVVGGGGSGKAGSSAPGADAGSVRRSTKDEGRHTARLKKLQGRKDRLESGISGKEKVGRISNWRINSAKRKIAAVNAAQAAGLGGGFITYRRQLKHDRKAKKAEASEAKMTKTIKGRTAAGASGVMAWGAQRRVKKMQGMLDKKEELTGKVKKERDAKKKDFEKKKTDALAKLDERIGKATGKKKERLQRERERRSLYRITDEGVVVPGKLKGFNPRGTLAQMRMGMGTNIRSGKRRFKSREEEKLDKVKKKIMRAQFGTSLKSPLLKISGPQVGIDPKTGKAVLVSTWGIGTVAGIGNARHNAEYNTEKAGKIESKLEAEKGSRRKKSYIEEHTQGSEDMTVRERVKARQKAAAEARKREWEDTDAARRQALRVLGFKDTDPYPVAAKVQERYDKYLASYKGAQGRLGEQMDDMTPTMTDKALKATASVLTFGQVDPHVVGGKIVTRAKAEAMSKVVESKITRLDEAKRILDMKFKKDADAAAAAAEAAKAASVSKVSAAVGTASAPATGPGAGPGMPSAPTGPTP